MATHPEVKLWLIDKDPHLQLLFNSVPELDFNKLYKEPYIALIGAIIGQLISYKEAKCIRGKLYNILNCNLSCKPSIIERISDMTLLSIGISQQKITIIRLLNRYLIKIGADKSHLTLDEIKSTKHVNGISNWTIQTTILTSFLDWDVFPLNDVFIQNRIKKLYNMNKKPTQKQVQELSSKWSPYRSFVCWYIWRWLN